MGTRERDPARRIASAEEVARRLAQVEIALTRTPEERELRPLMLRLWPADSQVRASPAAEGPAAPPAGEPSAAAPTGETTVTWPPGRSARTMGGIVAVLAIAVAAAL